MEKRIIKFSPPDLTEAEIAEVAAAMRSGWITTGPRTKLLERRLRAFIAEGRNDIDCTTDENREKYGNRLVCLGSATAAEELNLRVLGVGPGDEVVVPAYTYTATASAALHCGASVRFVDIRKDGDPDTHMPGMDPDALSAAINERTKAVIPVDLGGIPADYGEIFGAVEEKRRLFVPKSPDGTRLGDLSSRIQESVGRVAVVADSAHSLGASAVFRGERKNCGDIADFTSFSFHAVKNFTTAEGGAATWRQFDGIENGELYSVFQLLSLHGQNKDGLSKSQSGSWEYDIVGPWYKCNMTDITAAIGLVQLDRYPGLIRRRAEIIKEYDALCDRLGVFRLSHSTKDKSGSNHLYLTRIPGADEEKRNAVIRELAGSGVAANVHYKPLPMMTAYGADCSRCPNAYAYFRNLVTLPLHTLLSDDDVAWVCECFESAVRKVMR